MSAKMTPGPWSVDRRYATRGQVAAPVSWEICAGDTSLADLRWNGHNEIHGEANARAIACLPELIEAARNMLGERDCRCGCSNDLRRVLARIDGEEA